MMLFKYFSCRRPGEEPSDEEASMTRTHTRWSADERGEGVISAAIAASVEPHP